MEMIMLSNDDYDKLATCLCDINHLTKVTRNENTPLVLYLRNK